MTRDVTVICITWADEPEHVFKDVGCVGSLVIVHGPDVVKQINKTLVASADRYAIVLDGGVITGVAIDALVKTLEAEEPRTSVAISPALDHEPWWEPVNPCAYLVDIDRMLSAVGRLDERVNSFYHSLALYAQVQKHKKATVTWEHSVTAMTLVTEARSARLGEVYYDQIRDRDVVRSLE